LGVEWSDGDSSPVISTGQSVHTPHGSISLSNLSLDALYSMRHLTQQAINIVEGNIDNNRTAAKAVKSALRKYDRPKEAATGKWFECQFYGICSLTLLIEYHFGTDQHLLSGKHQDQTSVTLAKPTIIYSHLPEARNWLGLLDIVQDRTYSALIARQTLVLNETQMEKFLTCLALELVRLPAPECSPLLNLPQQSGFYVFGVLALTLKNPPLDCAFIRKIAQNLELLWIKPTLPNPTVTEIMQSYLPVNKVAPTWLQDFSFEEEGFQNLVRHYLMVQYTFSLAGMTCNEFEVWRSTLKERLAVVSTLDHGAERFAGHLNKIIAQLEGVTKKWHNVKLSTGRK
jgi:hypothetical protein